MGTEGTLLQTILSQVSDLRTQVTEVEKVVTTVSVDLKWVRGQVEETNKTLTNVSTKQADCRKEMEGRVEKLESWKDQIHGGWKTIAIIAGVLGFVAGLIPTILNFLKGG